MYSIWSQEGENYSLIGQAAKTDAEWSSVLFAPQPADVDQRHCRLYDPMIIDMVRSPLPSVSLRFRLKIIQIILLQWTCNDVPNVGSSN